MTTIIGGPEDNVFNETLGDGVTAVDGGGGFNTLTADWSSTSDAITSSSTGGDSGVFTDVVTGESLTYSQIQGLYFNGGSGDDLVVGTGSSDSLGGGSGNDTIVGGGGDDVIHGGLSTTAVFSGARDDYLVSQPASDVTTVYDQRPGAPDGFDTLVGVGRLQFADLTITPGLVFDFSGSSDSFRITYGADSGLIEDLTTGAAIPFDGVSSLDVTTGSGDDTFVITGPAGQFSFNGGAGQNHFIGDFGDESFSFALGSSPALVSGFPSFSGLGYLANIQTAEVTSNANYATITGGDGADRLDSGFGYGAVVDGGGGDDTVSGGFEVHGGAGDDILTGGYSATKYPPSVIMDGGAGDDTIYGRGIVGVGPIGGWQAAEIATYSGDQASYAIATDSQGVTTVTDLRPGSPDGTDTLINVAELRFADSPAYGGLFVLHGPLLTASAPSNDLVEASPGSAGIASATVSLDLTDSVGTPYFVDGSGVKLPAGPVLMVGQFGSATLDPTTNTMTYVLDNSSPATNALRTGEVATDTFTFGADDGRFDWASYTSVTFTIQGANDGPAPADDSLSTAYGVAVSVSAASLLANDNEPENFPLTLTAVGGAQHGTVTLNGDQVVFTPYVGYVGAAGFDYTVDDGLDPTATGHVAVTVTGSSPAYVYRGGVITPETIDFTGDSKSHQVLVGSGDTTVLMGAGGGSARLGAGDDVVIGGAGKDTVTFGPGLGTATGGTGPDAFIFVKGQIADPAAHGGQFDTITDFTGAGGYTPGRDFIWLQGFSHTSTVTYEHDLAGDPTAHLYRVDDGAYHAEFVLDYAGPGLALHYGQYGFLQ